jgi:hypothetical protein
MSHETQTQCSADCLHDLHRKARADRCHTRYRRCSRNRFNKSPENRIYASCSCPKRTKPISIEAKRTWYIAAEKKQSDYLCVAIAVPLKLVKTTLVKRKLWHQGALMSRPPSTHRPHRLLFLPTISPQQEGNHGSILWTHPRNSQVDKSFVKPFILHVATCCTDRDFNLIT